MAKQDYTRWYVGGLQTIVAASEASEKVAADNAKAANGPLLRKMLADGSEIAGRQTGMLKDLLQKAGGQPGGGGTDKAMEGIIQAGRDDIGSASDPDVVDAAVIATTQVGLHYYIAAYGTLAATAKHLDLREEAATISDMIDHMKKKDREYSQLAERLLAEQLETVG